MNKETLVKAVSEFQGTNKRYYRRDYPTDLTIKKVFNHGMGQLELFYFDLKRKLIAINNNLATASDLRKLREFCRDNHMDNWRQINTRLGYPNWYFNHLSEMAEKQVRMD